MFSFSWRNEENYALIMSTNTQWVLDWRNLEAILVCRLAYKKWNLLYLLFQGRDCQFGPFNLQLSLWSQIYSRKHQNTKHSRRITPVWVINPSWCPININEHHEKDTSITAATGLKYHHPEMLPSHCWPKSVGVWLDLHLLLRGLIPAVLILSIFMVYVSLIKMFSITSLIN